MLANSTAKPQAYAPERHGHTPPPVTVAQPEVEIVGESWGYPGILRKFCPDVTLTEGGTPVETAAHPPTEVSRESSDVVVCQG